MLEVAIRKRFDGFHLETAFTAGTGFIVLFGPSGSGKSLTLRTIAGTSQADAGHIIIDGQAVYDSARRINLPPQARRIGYVPQHYALFPHLTVEKNIGFGLRPLPRSERPRRIAELLELFRLQGAERRRPRELSGGQQQRVALARALAVQPRLLLLDEPFTALDAPLRSTLRQELVQLQARLGITILLVTHDLADAFALGEHVIVYHSGQVIQQGTRDEVFFHPQTYRVAELVGTSNILSAVVERTTANTLWVRWQGHQIAMSAAPLVPGTPVYICIRPTQILLVRPERLAERERENLFPCSIVNQQMQAETYTLQLRVDGNVNAYDLELALPAYVYHRFSLDTEKRVFIELRRQALHVIPRDVLGEASLLGG